MTTSKKINNFKCNRVKVFWVNSIQNSSPRKYYNQDTTKATRFFLKNE